MLGEEVVDPALALLSTAIWIIMEDHATDAVTSMPGAPSDRQQRFRLLGDAGADIAALSRAAEVLLNRREI